jgi:hypothetical protein
MQQSDEFTRDVSFAFTGFVLALVGIVLGLRSSIDIPRRTSVANAFVETKPKPHRWPTGT